MNGLRRKIYKYIRGGSGFEMNCCIYTENTRERQLQVKRIASENATNIVHSSAVMTDLVTSINEHLLSLRSNQ